MDPCKSNNTQQCMDAQDNRDHLTEQRMLKWNNLNTWNRQGVIQHSMHGKSVDTHWFQPVRRSSWWQ